MIQKIKVEFPQSRILVTATLLSEDEPEMCKLFWDGLQEPKRFACYNTLSTGHIFDAKPRPPKEPLKLGSQAQPLGRKKILLCDMEPGMIAFFGVNVLCAYGPHITEPIVAPGPVVALVDKDDLGKFEEAGMAIWNVQYAAVKTRVEPFQPHRMIIRRMEG